MLEAPKVDTSFALMLQQHRQGSALTELGQALRTVMDAALMTGKPGGITLKIAIAPTNSGAVEILEDIKVTMPKARKASTMFFVDKNGNLTRNNPDQLEMSLRAVEGGKPVDVETLRKVGVQ